MDEDKRLEFENFVDQQLACNVVAAEQLPDNLDGEERLTLGHSHRPAGSPDEFGDDDFDSDMVDALDTSPENVQQASLTSNAAIPAEPIGLLPRSQTQGSFPPEHPKSDNDDFGMDDEDDFAADLEHVASLYDSRSVEPTHCNHDMTADSTSTARTEGVVPVPVISLVDDDDDSDEFGEDIDVDEFAAAEVAATQVSTNTVRRTNTYP